MVIKREYRETEIERAQMPAVRDAFNAVRPQSATIDHDRDGQDVLLVRGWLDTHAAALVALVKGGYPAAMINEQSVAQRVLTDARAQGLPRDPALVGHVLDPEEGSPIDPLAPPPPEAPLMDLSDVPAAKPASQYPLPGPQAPVQTLHGLAGAPLPESRLRALTGALAALLGRSEEQALRWAIYQATEWLS
jgi:hypothetical protein